MQSESALQSLYCTGTNSSIAVHAGELAVATPIFAVADLGFFRGRADFGNPTRTTGVPRGKVRGFKPPIGSLDFFNCVFAKYTVQYMLLYLSNPPFSTGKRWKVYTNFVMLQLLVDIVRQTPWPGPTTSEPPSLQNPGYAYDEKWGSGRMLCIRELGRGRNQQCTSCFNEWIISW